MQSLGVSSSEMSAACQKARKMCNEIKFSLNLQTCSKFIKIKSKRQEVS